MMTNQAATTSRFTCHPEDLTQREHEMIVLIAQGLSNQEIVDRTYLSINSVKTYIRSAYRKLGVTGRTQAVVWAFRNGLGDLSPVAPLSVAS